MILQTVLFCRLHSPFVLPAVTKVLALIAAQTADAFSVGFGVSRVREVKRKSLGGPIAAIWSPASGDWGGCRTEIGDI